MESLPKILNGQYQIHWINHFSLDNSTGFSRTDPLASNTQPLKTEAQACKVRNTSRVRTIENPKFNSGKEILEKCHFCGSCA